LGENLVLRRTVTAEVGGNRVRIADTVTNEGWTDAGHMLLYHCNLGWPLISDAATLVVPSAEARPRGADAAAALPEWARLGPPTPGFREQVYCHTGFSADAVIVVDNPRAGLRLELRFSVRTLPALVQWKMNGEGQYVLGLEPANVGFLSGRRRPPIPAACRSCPHDPALTTGSNSRSHRPECRTPTTAR
jgi:hypothetical protein